MKATEQCFLRVREIEGKFLINFFHGRQELVRNIKSFEKSGLELQCLSEAELRETCHGSKNRKVRKIGISLYSN